METIDERQIGGFYICGRCLRQFPFYHRQFRRYCPDCLPAIASESGKRGGRPKKNERAKAEHQAEVMARALKIAEENQNANDTLNHD